MATAPDILQRLRAAAGGPPGAIHSDVETQDYDWRQPNCYTREHKDRLRTFADEVARKMLERAGPPGGAAPLEPAGITLHYGQELQEVLGQESNIYVGLRDGATGCGLVAVATAHAISWVTGRLGGYVTAAEAPARDLSGLERGLLVDMVGELTEGLSAALQAAGAGAVAPAEDIAARLGPLVAGAATEYCRLGYHPAGEEQGVALSFVLPCERLAPVAGTRPVRTDEPAEQIRQRMLAHLGRVGVRAEVQLGTVAVPLGEVADLTAGDVLLLDRSVSDPADLQVLGRVYLRGRPATSQGRYALQVTEICPGPDA